MTLTDVAVELYALPPAEFTAARNARAKRVRADGDRALAGQIQALRKPTLAAWAVDLLVRERPAQVEELLALGTLLLDAQEARAGDRLRELNRRQHDLMTALRGQARRLATDAGQRLGDAVDVPLEGTLRAAMTDPDAAAAVRSGLLVAELESTGFGPVEVGDAVAVPGAPPLTEPAAVPSPPPQPSDTADGRTAAGARAADDDAVAARAPQAAPQSRTDDERAEARRHKQDREAAARDAARRRERERAEHDLEAARSRAESADAALADAEAAVERARRDRAELDAEVERLAAELGSATERQQAAAVQERRARTAREAAVRAADTAARRAHAARGRLEALD